MIDFEFEFQYADEKALVLRNTAGSIPKGRCVVLCGGSGCGKSTLLRCINGLIPQFYEGELKGFCRLVGKDTDGLGSGEIGELAASVFEDWRMGLSMLIVLPLGILCFMSMFSGYNGKFQRTVTSTKALNDTAVEYIGGIDVIKAFGQSKNGYAKFVSAAKEGADCFIDWMRGTLSAETFLAVIVLSFGVMQPLITAFSYTDDIA